ncbi:unnamed protein product [Darwinula stevensoni]|uniref:Uncharacterized protein n=1 Tax=Darwinula stevensoni TaxID=69355 RepID=A0A7R8ZYZ9_9CRUS|nr:unnamed protein product [Darwinula stevensoni]CAG0881531.1 unnamed protein product [Darwinula stevensoni]
MTGGVVSATMAPALLTTASVAQTVARSSCSTHAPAATCCGGRVPPPTGPSPKARSPSVRHETLTLTDAGTTTHLLSPTHGGHPASQARVSVDGYVGIGKMAEDLVFNFSPVFWSYPDAEWTNLTMKSMRIKECRLMHSLWKRSSRTASVRGTSCNEDRSASDNSLVFVQN